MGEIYLKAVKLSRLLCVAAASSQDRKQRRLFITDPITRLTFLIDTGADISLIPPADGERKKAGNLKLFAANGGVIATYGERLLTLELGLRRRLPWRFIIADVSYPIIGADFLAEYGLLPDLKNHVIVDAETLLRGQCGCIDIDHTTICPIDRTSEFSHILSKFPGITCPTTRRRCKILHKTTHVIETNRRPVTARARRLPLEKLHFARSHFEELMRLGDIRPSKSAWASPVHIIPKAGPEKWRICGDYRRLNAVTVPDKYPVPNIGDFNIHLSGAVKFTTLDIKRAYHQIPVADGDIEKTAVITPFSLFEYVSMPFGLRNAAQTFQRFIDGLFRDLGYVYAYIDDILITSDDEQSHEERVDVVLHRLHNAGIVINPSKCCYKADCVQFLGYLVDRNGISPDPARIQPILKFERPKTEADLRRFLGMVNFYRRNIPHAAAIQRRLQLLITSNVRKNNTPVVWTPDAEAAFGEFKAALAKATLLAHPAVGARIVLSIDASDVAIGGALHQWHNGTLEPLAFFSRKLSPAETRYSTYDRELLAIFASIRHFRYQLEGRQFTVFTDHKPLKFAFSSISEKATPRVIRQLDFIGQFTTDIQYVPGVQNIPADVLSRLDAVLVPTKIPYDEVAQAQQSDPKFQRILASTDTGLRLKRIAIPNATIPLYCNVNESRCRPFLTTQFRKMAFDMVHNLSHPGPRSMAKLVARRFVWPGIERDCRTWARACLACQKVKVSRHTRTPFGKFEEAARFEHLHLDIVGPLPPSSGNTYVITMIDRATRWPEAVPTNDITAENVAAVVVRTWVARFGAPRRITTDQGRQFESQLFKQLAARLGIERIRTTAYHPQANGCVERWHRTFKAAIRAYSTNQWCEILPLVLLGLRVAINSDTGVSAAQLTYGTELHLPGEFFDNSSTPITSTRDFVQQLSASLWHFAQRSRTHGATPIFIPSNLSTCNYVFVRSEVKSGLDPPYAGPFRVIERSDKTITISRNGSSVGISIDRVKPAFTLEEPHPEVRTESQVPPVISYSRHTRVQPARAVRFCGKYPK